MNKEEEELKNHQEDSKEFDLDFTDYEWRLLEYGHRVRLNDLMERNIQRPDSENLSDNDETEHENSDHSELNKNEESSSNEVEPQEDEKEELKMNIIQKLSTDNFEENLNDIEAQNVEMNNQQEEIISDKSDEDNDKDENGDEDKDENEDEDGDEDEEESDLNSEDDKDFSDKELTDTKQKYLKYGSKIKFNLMINQSKHYLVSNGIPGDYLYFEEDDLKSLNGFEQNNVFIVVPDIESKVSQNIYENIKKLNKYNEHKKELKNSKETKKEDICKDGKQTVESMIKLKEDYPKALSEEMKKISDFLAVMKGQPVKYNSSIQLIHYKTSQYVEIVKVDSILLKIAGSKFNNDSYLNPYRLKLATHSSPSTLLTFVPSFKCCNGNNILTDDNFLISHRDPLTMKNLYLTKRTKYISLYEDARKLDYEFWRFSLYNLCVSDEEKSLFNYENIITPEVSNRKAFCSKLYGRTLWITHYNEPYYLCIDKIEEEENEFIEEDKKGGIIRVKSDDEIEKLDADKFIYDTKANLYFKKYDRRMEIPIDGLWTCYYEFDGDEVLTLMNVL